MFDSPSRSGHLVPGTLHCIHMTISQILRFFSFTRLKKNTSASRIVYLLPDTGLKKCFNLERLFSDINWGDWQEVIDEFEKRVAGWYFHRLPTSRDLHAAYIVLSTVSALVDTLSQYERGLDWHDDRQYCDYLRKKFPGFRNSLANPFPVTKARGKNPTVWTPKMLKDVAHVFYSGVRCSLLHHGDLASYAGMSSFGPHGTKLFRQIQSAGQSKCGSHVYSLTIFDPWRIAKRLEVVFKEYCEELRRKPKGRLAENLQKQLRESFGVSI